MDHAAYVISGQRLYATLKGGLPPFMAFTRASAGSGRDLDDGSGERWTLTYGTDVPIFHRPLGSAVVGLRVWSARTNYALRSNEVQTAPWGAALGTPTATGNNRAAPDGTTTGCDLLDNDAGVNEIWSNQITDAAIDGQTVTGSIYLRNITSTRASMHAVETAGAGSRVRAPSASATWARVDGTVPSTIDGDAVLQLHEISAGADYPDAGSETGTGTASWWGGQIEIGADPSPLIPTVAAAVAEAADKPVLTVAKLGGRITADKGRIAQRIRFGRTNAGYVTTAFASALASGWGIFFDNADDKLKVKVNAVDVLETAALTFSRWTSECWIDWKWGGGRTSCRIVQDGTERLNADAAWTAPTLGASIFVGTDHAGAQQLDGIVSDLVIG